MNNRVVTTYAHALILSGLVDQYARSSKSSHSHYENDLRMICNLDPGLKSPTPSQVHLTVKMQEIAFFAELGNFSNFKHYIMKKAIFFLWPDPEIAYFYNEIGLEVTLLTTQQNCKPQNAQALDITCMIKDVG